jgi:hypothetical protein
VTHNLKNRIVHPNLVRDSATINSEPDQMHCGNQFFVCNFPRIKQIGEEPYNGRNKGVSESVTIVCTRGEITVVGPRLGFLGYHDLGNLVRIDFFNPDASLEECEMERI